MTNSLKIGKYKVQVFDKDANDYLPTPHGIGMHVEVRDPEQKVVLSKVNEIFFDTNSTTKKEET